MALSHVDETDLKQSFKTLLIIGKGNFFLFLHLALQDLEEDLVTSWVASTGIRHNLEGRWEVNCESYTCSRVSLW